MAKFWTGVAVVLLYLLNKLPMRALFLLSDMIFPLLYYVVKYRRKVVRKNLRNSFPDKSEKELLAIEKDFYHRMCDYFVESIKFYGMSEKEIKERMQFTGLDEVHRMLDAGHSCVCYMAHTFNWEFVTSLPLHMHAENTVTGAIYHKLRNPRFDKIFKTMRTQYGADSVSMKNTLRRIMEIVKSNRKFVFGFIADQIPKMEAMNHWVTFLNQDTPVFTGAEKIARRVKASVFYLQMERVARGKYVAHFELVVEDASTLPEFALTDDYFRRCEEDIKERPSSWLWTHNRWKRTRASYEAFQNRIEERRRRLNAATENAG